MQLSITECDCALLLVENGISFRANELYLFKGEPSKDQGWLLHISVVQSQLYDLLKAILPVLIESDFPFKVIKNQRVLGDINFGIYGIFKYGKAITVYLEHEEKALSLLEKLSLLTEPFACPTVWTDFKVNKHLYIRYGAFLSHLTMDSLERRHRTIMDRYGHWAKDVYSLSPTVPKGVANPFRDWIRRAESQPIENPLRGRYFLGKRIRSDIKGMDWDAFYKDHNNGKRHCVITRVKRGAMSDLLGRDMIDRMSWVFDVYKHFSNSFVFPNVIDYWREGDHAFLALEYLKGRNLADRIAEVQKRTSWSAMDTTQQKELIGYLLKIVDIIKEVRRGGFVLRDLNASNFFVLEDGSLRIVNWELIYSVAEEMPSLPFQGGMRGYVLSTELTDLPLFKDDIYSFGALLVLTITGLQLYRINRENTNDELEGKLTLLINNKRLVNLILSCLLRMQDKYPEWDIISEELNGSSAEIAQNSRYLPFTNDIILEKIYKGLKYLGSTKLMFEGKWVSYIDNPYDDEVYPLQNRHTFSGLYRGIGGVLYLLGKVMELGWNIDYLNDAISNALDFLDDFVGKNHGMLSLSMYHGIAGQALLIKKLLPTGLISKQPDRLNDIMRDLGLKSNRRLDVLYGIAGQGLALLECLDRSEYQHIMPILDGYANHLANVQQQNGSWRIMTIPDKPGVTFTGFGNGMAGIIYFLLEYGNRCRQQFAMEAAYRGLDYLESLSLQDRGYYVWPISDLNPARSIWWDLGSAGIALTYLRAYEITKRFDYLLVAERTLLGIQETLIYRNLSQSRGLSGIGEVYLEAFRITRDQRWLDRAALLVKLICGLQFTEGINGGYWLVDNREFPTADFMVGCSGVIHFLVRYLYPDKVFFPFLPETSLASLSLYK